MSTETNSTTTTESQSTESVEAKASDVAAEETSSEESQGVENADQESEGEEAEGEQEVVEDRPKKKSGIQRLKERHNREMAEIRQQLENLKTQRQEGQREDSVSQSKDKPTADKFETHEEFVEALTDWKLEQRERANELKSKEAKAKESYQSTLTAHQERLAKFREANPKFDDVIEDFTEEHGDVKLSAAVNQSIIESDLGPAILMELAGDHEELKRINSLSATAAAREIGKIEARLEQKTKKTETKTTTKAPPPLKPVTAGAATAAKKSVYDEGISFKDFERLRREQMRKKRA